MKPFLRIAVSALLTLLFLALFVRSFDLGAAWRSLATAAPGLLALSVLVNLASFPVRAWRWRVLLSPVRKGLGLYNLTSCTVIGFMVSFLVPFRVGEVVRPVLLARRERLSASAAIASVALARLLDAFAVMVLFLAFVVSARGQALLGAGAAGDGQAALFLRRAMVAAAVFVGAGMPILLAIVLFPGAAAALLHRLAPGGGAGAGRAARLAAVLENFAAGLGVLRRGGALVRAVALSLLLWLVIDLSVLLGVRAFGLPLHLPDIFLLMVPLAVGIAVPTPGGVGPYEFLAGTALSGFWAVPAALAAATAVTLHAVSLLPTIAAGLLFMWRDGLRAADVRVLVRSGEAAPGPA